ncbi:MAG: hypothetical protein OK454_07910 [Thaumarchaeota archaeon]|nr:hypothetical protein [Nitrososphaerota archaeon]
MRERERGRAEQSGKTETNLVPHDGLLDGSKVLQGRQKNVSVGRAANVFDEAAELLAQGD